MAKIAGNCHTLNDAIIKAEFGKFNYILISLSGIILTSSMLEASSIGMVLPMAGCELDLSNAQKGFLGSVSYVGIILSSHFWGFLADTRGRRRVLVPALFLAFVFTVVSSLATSFWTLALFRLLNGLCICAAQSIIYAFLGEFHSSERSDRVMMMASVAYGVLSLINPIGAMIFLHHDDWRFRIPVLDLDFASWRMFVLLCGIPSAISAVVLMIYVPESPKFTYSQGDEATTLKILRDVFRKNTGKSILEYEVMSLIKDGEFGEENPEKSRGFLHFVWSQTVPLFKRPHVRNTLTACFLQFGICITVNGFWTFFPEIQNKMFLWMAANDGGRSTMCSILDQSANRTLARAMTSEVVECTSRLETDTFINITILTLLYSVGWLVISFIIDFTGKLLIIVSIMFVCGLSSILLVFIDVPSVSVYLYVVLQAAGLNMTLINASTVELFPTSLRAMAVAISMMIGRIGSAVGSNFVGLAIKSFCTYTWLVPAFLLITGGLLSFTIPNIGERRKFAA